MARLLTLWVAGAEINEGFVQLRKSDWQSRELCLRPSEGELHAARERSVQCPVLTSRVMRTAGGRRDAEVQGVDCHERHGRRAQSKRQLHRRGFEVAVWR